jgi:hypothetical protein
MSSYTPLASGPGDRMTTPPAVMVLDNEGVQVLADVHHPKHRRALSFFQVANQRSGRRREPVAIVVPVAVRVETGWDRTAASAAALNRIDRARDIVLDARAADRAGQLPRMPACRLSLRPLLKPSRLQPGRSPSSPPTLRTCTDSPPSLRAGATRVIRL